MTMPASLNADHGAGDVTDRGNVSDGIDRRFEASDMLRGVNRRDDSRRSAARRPPFDGCQTVQPANYSADRLTVEIGTRINFP